MLPSTLKRRLLMVSPVREAIRDRLDPIIEEIVTREISERGGYGRGGEQGRSFEALMPILLSTLVSRRQTERGQEQGIESVLPILLPLLTSRRQVERGQEQGIESVLPILLPLLMSRRQSEQEQERPLESVAPLLVAALSAR